MSGVRRHRGGFTLVEMVVASAISAILLMSLGGIVVLSASAVPAMNERARTRQDVAAFIADLRLELQAAGRIENVVPAALQFTIPDRDGDGQPETILYLDGSGTGVSRGPDAAALAMVLPGARVRFAAERSVRTERVPGISVEDAADVLLANFDAGGWNDPHNPNTIRLMPIHRNQWAAQMLEPTAPADAIAWRPTILSLPISNRNGKGDTISVELRRAAELHPGGAAESLRFRAITPPGNNSPTKQWRNFEVADAEAADDGLLAGLIVPRDESLAMVIGSERAATAASFAQIAWSSPADPPASTVHGRAFSDDGGETWARYGEQALEHAVTGRWIRRSSDVLVLDHVFVEAIHVSIEMDGRVVHAGRIDLPARPRLDAGRWELEVVDGTLEATGWTPPTPPETSWSTASSDRLTTPVVVEFEFDSAEAGATAGFVVRADRSPGVEHHAPVFVRYRQLDSGARRVEVFTGTATDGWELVSWWTKESPGGTLDGRLVVFPEADNADAAVAVELGGRYRGTFASRKGSVAAGESLVFRPGAADSLFVRLSVTRPRPLP